MSTQLQTSFEDLVCSSPVIGLEDQVEVSTFLDRFPPDISELTFSNLFCWRETYPRKVVRYNGNLLFGYRNESSKSFTFLQPVGPDPINTMKEISKMARIIWHRVDNSIAMKLHESFTIEPSDAESDYVYQAEKMTSLEGSSLATIRRKVNKARKLRNTIKPFGPELISDCHRIIDRWIESKGASITPDHIEDALASREMLDAAHRLPILGIVIYVDNNPECFVLGERLAPKVGVIHFHKGNFTIEGLGAYSLNKMAAQAFQGFDFINFMQAKGDPGLTQWKESWNPIKKVQKVVINPLQEL